MSELAIKCAKKGNMWQVAAVANGKMANFAY